MENLIRSDYNEIHPIEVITFERIMKVPKFYNLYHINDPDFIPKRYNQGICPSCKFENGTLIGTNIPKFLNCYESPFKNHKTLFSNEEGDFIFDFSSKGILNYKKCSCDKFFFVKFEEIGDSSKCRCCNVKVNMECSGCLYQYLYRKSTYEFFIKKNLSFIIREYEKNYQFRNFERNFQKSNSKLYENITLEDNEIRLFKYLRNDIIRYILLYLWSNLEYIKTHIYEKIFNNLIWFMAHKIYLYKLECIDIKSCPCINKIYSYEKYIPFEPNEPLYKMIIETSDIINIIQKSKIESLKINDTFDDNLFFNS